MHAWLDKEARGLLRKDKRKIGCLEGTKSTTADFSESGTESKLLQIGWDPQDHLVQPVT